MDLPVRDILLDNNGNRVLVGTDYGRASGEQAVKQSIECSVKLFRGEYWLDLLAGVPWLTDILIKNPNTLIVKAAIGTAIAAVPNVTQVANVGFTPPDAERRAAIAYSAVTDIGLIDGTVTT